MDFNWRKLFFPQSFPTSTSVPTPQTDKADGQGMSKSLRDFAKESSTQLALVASFTKIQSDRKEFQADFAPLKNFYLVDVITQQLVEDALSPDITTNEVIEISSTNADYAQKLRELQDTLDFDAIASDVAEELVHRGEYSYKLTVDKEKGVTDVADDVDQDRIAALYNKGIPEHFLVQSEDGRKLEMVPGYQYAHFCFSSRKIRLNLKTAFFHKQEAEIPANFPKLAKVGRPFFYGVCHKLKELQLLEMLVPASRLAEMSRGSLVGVQVPTGTAPKEAFDVMRSYERILNSGNQLAEQLGQSGEAVGAKIQDILSAASKIKAVPIFGERGTLSNLSDIRANTVGSDIIGSVDSLRGTILASVGIPPELVFGGDVSKGELLKRYARYLRRVKSLQSAIASGVKHICYVHLLNSGIKGINTKDIQVRFRNEFVHIDELEKLEFVDATVSTVTNIVNFIDGLRDHDSYKDIVDDHAVRLWLSRVSALIYANASIIKEVEDDTSEKPVGKIPVKNVRVV